MNLGTPEGEMVVLEPIDATPAPVEPVGSWSLESTFPSGTTLDEVVPADRVGRLVTEDGTVLQEA